MERLIEEIVAWLRARKDEAGAKGFVLGLSGGVDSAVVAALCVRAVGKESVSVAWLPCHSLSEDYDFARMTAEALGLQMTTIDLAPAFDAMTAALPPGSDLARANIKPRLRMIALYHMAQSRNALVAGTGNKTETLVGYFTKFGDGGVDIKPIGDLYKREVWELARALDLPKPVIERPPTAGLWPGQTDEGEMGVSYAELDTILAALEAGQKPQASAEIIARIERMRAVSDHKRALAPTFSRK
ncbi:MAG: NAD+ synthase [Vicinamibacteria bacterium]|jgi:NAD+ synthase|nr:NAD+ synthase [Vicinamibacteria bacterium]